MLCTLLRRVSNSHIFTCNEHFIPANTRITKAQRLIRSHVRRSSHCHAMLAYTVSIFATDSGYPQK